MSAVHNEGCRSYFTCKNIAAVAIGSVGVALLAAGFFSAWKDLGFPAAANYGCMAAGGALIVVAIAILMTSCCMKKRGTEDNSGTEPDPIQDPKRVKQQEEQQRPAHATPLHAAVAEMNLDEVERLLANRKADGLDINAQDKLGRTPLHIAVQTGRQALVNSLVKAGAKLDIRTYEEGNMPLHMISAQTNGEVIIPILNACERHRPDLLTAQNKAGQTPLDIATKAGATNQRAVDALRPALARIQK